METHENDIPARAGERYRRTWERYLIAVRPSPLKQAKFIQIIPREAGVVPSLHGVNVKFPDGVTLTFQDCTPEGIVTLIETYERRRSAREAAACSR